ncbi:hypothetical protein HDV01_007048 [Terramyces sp. JEL0728]|nr:hypothetical protein HDV01_007048 [Terramyces sp. JEL0728]
MHHLHTELNQLKLQRNSKKVHSNKNVVDIFTKNWLLKAAGMESPTFNLPFNQLPTPSETPELIEKFKNSPQYNMIYICANFAKLDINEAGSLVCDDARTNEILAASVIFSNGIEAATEFLSAQNIKLTLTLSLLFCKQCLDSNQSILFFKYFNLLRSTWQPLSKAHYESLVIWHMKYIIRKSDYFYDRFLFLKGHQKEVGKRVQVMLLSLKWLLNYMSLNDMRPDSLMYHYVILGFCRADLTELALIYYNEYKKMHRPTLAILDYLIVSHCRQYNLDSQVMVNDYRAVIQDLVKEYPASASDFVLYHLGLFELQFNDSKSPAYFETIKWSGKWAKKQMGPKVEYLQSQSIPVGHNDFKRLARNGYSREKVWNTVVGDWDNIKKLI